MNCHRYQFLSCLGFISVEFTFIRDQKKRRIIPVFALSLSALLIQSCSQQPTGRSQHVKRIYVGGGIGASQVKPDTDGSGFRVSDSRDTSQHVTLGYDISERISVEAEIADLGTSELKPRGEVDYQTKSLSGIYYGWKKDPRKDSREGLSAYARVGVSTIDNKARDVQYKQAHDAQMLIGGGLEYGFENGLAVRGEVTSYDTDAMRVGLSVIYRFNNDEPLIEETPLPQKEPAKPQKVAEKPVEKAPAPTVIEKPKPTPPPVQSWPILYFGFDSSLLTPTAINKLQRIANAMQKYPSLEVLLEGHTDNIGSEPYNLKLALRRATAAKQYLIKHGISETRLRISVHGSKKPVNMNRTADERARNRRVEVSRQP